MPFNAKLHDDIDQQIQQVLDISAGQLLAATALLDQQHQLLEGKLGTRRMDTRDRAWVT